MGPIISSYIKGQLYYIKWEDNTKAVFDGLQAMQDSIDARNKVMSHRWGNEGGVDVIRQEMFDLAYPIVNLQTKVWLQSQAEEVHQSLPSIPLIWPHV